MIDLVTQGTCNRSTRGDRKHKAHLANPAQGLSLIIKEVVIRVPFVVAVFAERTSSEAHLVKSILTEQNTAS